MQHTRSFKSFAAAIACVLFLNQAPGAEDEFNDAEKLFALKVKPLLADKCLACHGNDPDKIKGGLELLSREDLLRGGDTSDKVLVPGNAESSLLYLATTWTDPDLEMPPKENDRLTEKQTWQIRDWINGGAPWLTDEQVAAVQDRFAEGVRVATSGGMSEDWTNRRYEEENLWAYQPLADPTIPVGGEPHPVDAFIGRSLNKAGLSPAPMADRRTLIRRATYDLLGLPPTPSQISDFIADPAPDGEAFERVIDRLLESPHYGERMARHWLDVVRYADSSGFANDYARGNTWRYRDYVIRSFNEDKPYDQFVREQIAGDEIDPSDPELLVATGFLRMGPWELTGMEVAKVARQRFLDDVTDSVGQTFLAQPLQCAKCHDHKFDPIPTRDYYRMQSVFATTQLADREAPFLEEENTSGFEEREYLLQRKRRFQEQLNELNAKEEAAAREWYAERGLEYIPRDEGLRKGIPEEKLAPKKVGFSVEDYGLERIARKGLERLRWELERYEPVAFSVYSGRSRKVSSMYRPVRMPEDRMEKGEVETVSILAGGDPFSPIQEVTPGVLSCLPGSNDTKEATPYNSIPEAIEGRRLALAEWIASEQNPLAVRTMVNRIWLWHFGRGIADNPNNFGATGNKPSHPELLDWLGTRFIEQGWSIKSMHRLIMTSKAYQRSTTHPDPEELEARDPNRTLYAAFEPRRLTAEEIRDSMLRVSGELNPELGGIPIRPEMNLEAAMQPRMVMGTFAAAWQPSPKPEQRHRRSIYALKIRGLRDPFMEVFNEPGPDLSCEARETSTVTPQVFSLFNAQPTINRAVAFALHLQQETEGQEEAIRRAFQLAYGRKPAGHEVEWCLEHWNKMNAYHRDRAFPDREYPEEIVREAVEENTGERFKFTEVLDFYRGFEPDPGLEDVDAETRALADVCLVLFNSNEFIYVY